jgi:hypothetical protein
MEDQENSKIEVCRKYYATSGRECTTKRKLSGEIEVSTEKRGKKTLDLDTDTDSSSSSLSEPQTSMDPGELAKAMKQVMMDDDFSDMLTRKFKKICDERIEEKTEEMKTELINVKYEQNKQKDGLESVKIQVDNLEQDRRLKNLLVRGVHAEGRNLRQVCIETLNREMKTHLKTADIMYATSIGTPEDKLVKMAFNDGMKRDEVYAARAKLKGKELWITEDLTPRKAQLYYKARQGVKQGLGVLTWTQSGKIFVKMSSNAKPKIINCEDDLPKPRPPTSSETEPVKKE